MKKALKINLVAVFTAVMTLGMMSFKSMNNLFVDQWYTIENLTGSELTDEVGIQINNPGDAHPDCAAVSDDVRCAYFLSLPTSYDPTGKTIGDIMTDLSLTNINELVLDRGNREE